MPGIGPTDEAPLNRVDNATSLSIHDRAVMPKPIDNFHNTLSYPYLEDCDNPGFQPQDPGRNQGNNPGTTL